MTKPIFLILLIVCFGFTACQKKLTRYSKTRNTVESYQHLNDSILQLTGVSTDVEYGLSEKKPIMLGMVDVHKAAENIEKYLNALRSPTGELIAYKRLKPCCPFKTKNFTYTVPFFNIEYDHKHGMLEKYSVEYNTTTATHNVVLFFNLYDETKTLLAPKGFGYAGK
jgi:hypothetical protein